MKESRYVYLSGPITSNPDYMQQFSAAEKMAKSVYGEGSVVWNPAKLQHGNPPYWYMDQCLLTLTRWKATNQDVIVLALPGIIPSSGAVVEIAYAKYLGFSVIEIQLPASAGAASRTEQAGGSSSVG